MRYSFTDLRLHGLPILFLLGGTLFLTGQESGCEDDPDADGDGWTSEDGDCDDGDADVHPGADEVCDGKDNDCSGEIDDNPDAEWVYYYLDDDRDGYGDPDTAVESCSPPGSEYVLDGTDCDDTDRTINPGASETCDGVDEDCNGEIDDNPKQGGENYPADADGDGFGSPTATEKACSGPDNELDCNDEDPAEPQVVSADADSSMSDGTIDYPWATIQDGIDNASECVAVTAGTYYEAVDFGGAAVSVFSLDGPDATIIDATEQNDSVVTFATEEGADSELSGFTLTGGTGHLEITEDSTSCGSSETCTEYIYTYCGGGVYLGQTTPTLSNLTIVENYLPEASSSEDGNDTYYYYSFGGGICFNNAFVTVSQVDVWGNYADIGGGVYVDERSRVTFNEAFVGNNAATEGGGTAVDGGNLTISNVVSSFNEATEAGGGIMAIDGSLTENNVTHGGESGVTGGAIYLYGESSGTVDSSIVYGSTGVGILADSTATFAGTYNNVYGNSDGEYSGADDPTGADGNISEDPLFTAYSDDGDPMNDDFTLSEGSPSIDAGNPAANKNDADRTTNDQGAFGGPSSDWNTESTR